MGTEGGAGFQDFGSSPLYISIFSYNFTLFAVSPFTPLDFHNGGLSSNVLKKHRPLTGNTMSRLL